MKKLRNDSEFVLAWLMFYEITAEHIRQRALQLLFPGYRETDIFAEIVEYWNSYDDPDVFWVGELYENFEKTVRRKHWFLSLSQTLRVKLRIAVSSAEEQKKFFFLSTRIREFVPGFSVPIAGKWFFLLCYSQIFRVRVRDWSNIWQKQPGLDDIALNWYHVFYKPVTEYYKKFLFPVSFEKFYFRFSKRYYDRILTGHIKTVEALDKFAQKLV